MCVCVTSLESERSREAPLPSWTGEESPPLPGLGFRDVTPGRGDSGLEPLPERGGASRRREKRLFPAMAAAGLPFLLLVPALGSFLFTFGTGVELIRFVSLRAVLGPSQARTDAASSPQWGAAWRDPKVLHPLMVDMGLILLFILQHSLMATDRVKHWTSSCFGVLQRSFYVFCTALAIQLLMRYWQPVQDGPFLWNTSTEPWVTWVPLICFILHFVAWLVIFSIILIFDYAELMGVKQVYYHCLGMGDPLAVKSSRAVRLYSHLRHPVYLEFLLVLWAVPCLSLDRLLLASLFTAYLTCAHSLDQQDYLYLRAQLDKKFHVFSREEAAYGDLLAQNGPSAYKEN